MLWAGNSADAVHAPVPEFTIIPGTRRVVPVTERVRSGINRKTAIRYMVKNNIQKFYGGDVY